MELNELVFRTVPAVVNNPETHDALGYAVWSVLYASIAVARARMSVIVRFCRPRCTAFRRLGIAVAARIPMMAMTIRSSINVKPELLRLGSDAMVPPGSFPPQDLKKKGRVRGPFLGVVPSYCWVPSGHWMNVPSARSE